MIESLSIICIVLVLGSLILSTRKGIFKINKKTVELFVPTLICGFVLHYIALDFKGTGDPTILLILHSILSSIKMFAVDIDFSTISALAKSNVLFLIAITVVNTTAILTTSLVLWEFFCKSLSNKVRFSNACRTNRIIVVGNNNYVKLFVQDLIAQGEKSIIIVTDSDDVELKKYWIRRKIAVLSGKITVNTFAKLKVSLNKHKVKLVCLLDKDEDNLNVSLKLTDYLYNIINAKVDSIYNKSANKNESDANIEKKQLFNSILEQFDFASFIMYKEIDRIAHFKFAENFFGKIRFFNIYDIIARQFILDYPITKQLPSKFINTEKATLIDNIKINHIYVGFGDINRQLLLKNVCNNQMLGIDFNAVVFDSTVETPSMQFRNLACGLFETEKQDELLFLPKSNEKYNISFKSDNVLSNTFYDEIKKLVKANDFTQIVVALGDEKLTIETALELRQKLCEFQLLDKTSFFARIKNKDSYLNNPKFNDDFKNNKIEFFGNEQDSLIYDVIVNENLDKIAKKISANYGTNKFSLIKESDNWNKLSTFSQESNRFSAYGIRIKLNLLGLDLTKDSKNAISEDEYNEIYYFNEQEKLLRTKLSKDNYIEIFLRNSNGSFKNTKRNNLAKLEHIRWNTLHFCYGWDRMPIEMLKCDAVKLDKIKLVRKSEKIKKHLCLTTFEGLDTLTKLSLPLLLNLGVTQSQALFEAESIRYDFDTMDCLFSTLSDSGYFVKKL